ncbi:hypothetical protein J2T57_001649 [Natronocella acetinitrilica]|uniref:Uncharacterized protein n=1 Tax=Natronocella acetinitrilica TaxID=414046 RepID=A0AAE3G626_9GAMM|nr:hypothetical protein [Natronocella acetinitrilica]MCP1674547.1 hypothetical protein [Natronocella acetinitrilica]
MLVFDLSLMRAVHVFITKVTQDFVYVTSAADGAPYAPAGSEPGSHHGLPVSRVRIPPTVAQDFSRYNPVREFVAPRLASLNYYGDHIVSLELQHFDLEAQCFAPPESWQGMYESRINTLGALIGSHTAYINGLEIIWQDERDDGEGYALGGSGRLSLVPVRGVRLDHLATTARQRYFAKMVSRRMTGARGAGARRRSAGAPASERATQVSAIEAEVVPLEHGRVLAYTAAPGITVFSPLLQRSKSEIAGGNPASGTDQVKAVFALSSGDDPCYPNIEFVLHAARTVGALYGHEAADFLDIPRVIEQTGEVNLKSIARSSRLSVPVAHLPMLDCLAWVFGHVHRERDLDAQRALSRMFRFILRQGMVRASQVAAPRRAGAEDAALPMVRYQARPVAA